MLVTCHIENTVRSVKVTSPTGRSIVVKKGLSGDALPIIHKIEDRAREVQRELGRVPFEGFEMDLTMEEMTILKGREPRE